MIRSARGTLDPLSYSPNSPIEYRYSDLLLTIEAPLSISDNPGGGIRTYFTRSSSTRAQEDTMLWTLFVVLLVLWLLGVISSYTLGGFIHLLLVLAVLALIFQLLSDRHSVV